MLFLKSRLDNFAFEIARQQPVNTNLEPLLRCFITGKTSSRDTEELERQALKLNLAKAIAETRDNFFHHLLHAPQGGVDEKAEHQHPNTIFEHSFHKQNLEGKKATLRSLKNFFASQQIIAATPITNFGKEMLSIFDRVDEIMGADFPKKEKDITKAHYRNLLTQTLQKDCAQLLQVKNEQEFLVKTKRLSEENSQVLGIDDNSINAHLSQVAEQLQQAQNKIIPAAIANLPVHINTDELSTHRININAKDEELNTFLHYAIFNQDTTLMRFLLNHGAKLDVANKDGDTALHIAAQTGNPHVLRLLKEHIKPPQRLAVDEKAPTAPTPWLQVNKTGLTAAEILFNKVCAGKKAEAQKLDADSARAEKLHLIFTPLRKHLFKEISSNLVLREERKILYKKLKAVDEAFLSLSRLETSPKEALNILNKKLTKLTEKKIKKESFLTLSFRLAEKLYYLNKKKPLSEEEKLLETTKKRMPTQEELINTMKNAAAKDNIAANEQKAGVLKVHGDTLLHVAAEHLDKERFQEWRRKALASPQSATAQDIVTANGNDQTPPDLLIDTLEQQQQKPIVSKKIELQALQVFHEVEAYLHKKLSQYKGEKEAKIFEERIRLIEQSKKSLVNLQVLNKEQALFFIHQKIEGLMKNETIHKSRGSFQSKSDTYHLLREQKEHLEKHLQSMAAEEKAAAAPQHIAAAAA
jgi:ankyrin repeat protein